MQERCQNRTFDSLEWRTEDGIRQTTAGRQGLEKQKAIEKMSLLT